MRTIEFQTKSTPQVCVIFLLTFYDLRQRSSSSSHERFFKKFCELRKVFNNCMWCCWLNEFLFGSHESSCDCGEGMFAEDGSGEVGDSERGVRRLLSEAAADEAVKLFSCGGNKCEANAKPCKPAKCGNKNGLLTADDWSFWWWGPLKRASG